MSPGASTISNYLLHLLKVLAKINKYSPPSESDYNKNTGNQ